MDKKIVSLGALAIIIIATIVGIFLYKDLTQRPGFSEIDVKKGNLEEVLNLNGKIKSENNADLGFELGGRIIELTHKVGDRVEKNEILARANDENLATDYKKNAALLRSSEANLIYYQELLGKGKDELKSLKKTGANTPDKDAQKNQIAASQAQVEAQIADVEAAKASVQNIQAQINQTIIRAPFAGILAKQDVEVGEVASNNSAIMTLINENAFKIEVFASELDAKKIGIGNKAEITLDDNASKIYSASVTAIDPAETLQNNISTYKITLTFDDKTENVKSGTDANVKIVLGDKTGVIVIPKDAIYTENNKNFVYFSAAGIRERREVSAGAYDDNGMTEITKGLQEGDKIFKLAN
jgi:HlyD family secretion protein